MACRPSGRGHLAARSGAAVEEDFGPVGEACQNRGKLTIASLKGSFDGQAWRSTPGGEQELAIAVARVVLRRGASHRPPGVVLETTGRVAGDGLGQPATAVPDWGEAVAVRSCSWIGS